MKIQDCQVDISCQRTASEESELRTTTRVTSQGQWQNFKEMMETFRKEGKALPQDWQQQAGGSWDPLAELSESWSAGALASSGEDRRRRVDLMLQDLITQLFALLAAEKEKAAGTGQGSGSSDPLAGLGGSGGAGGGGGQGGKDCPPGKAVQAVPRSPQIMVLDWESSTSFKVKESESTQVCASGTVRTKDGRCIDFDLEVAMQRSFEAEYQNDSKGSSLVLKDPLVLNFDGKAAELADTRFDFDLDSDGKAESVAGLGRSSAFLALDRNKDGVINNGKELFGADSGNGFADLKAYDSDGNNWIDEADAVYADLRVWRPGSEGNDGKGGKADKAGGQLQTLQEAGVGALWLGSVDSQFSLKDEARETQAQVRQTGLWLSEDGRAGALQQVDLATRPAGSEARSAAA